jgi:SAM-dependent methyltransferase
MEKGNFRLYAAYYDLLYRDKDYAREVKYVVSLLRRNAVRNGSSLLNLGCGTGKHDLLLGEAGYRVYGVDLSEGMVRLAIERAAGCNLDGKLRFSHGDVRLVRLGERFDAVLALFHVMSYQVTDGDILDTLNTAGAHLGPGGIFIFDCWNGPAVLADPPLVKEKRVADDRMEVLRRTKPVVHQNEHIVDVHFDVEVTEKGRGDSEKFQELHRMRYLFRDELEVLAGKAGFGLKEVFKWLTLEEPGPKDWYTVYILEKK